MRACVRESKRSKFSWVYGTLRLQQEVIGIMLDNVEALLGPLDLVRSQPLLDLCGVGRYHLCQVLHQQLMVGLEPDARVCWIIH